MDFEALIDYMLRPLNSEEEIAETIRVRDEWLASHLKLKKEQLEEINEVSEYFDQEILRLELEKNGRNPKVMTHSQLMYVLMHGWRSGEEAIEVARIRREWIAFHPDASEVEMDQIYEVGEILIMAIEGYELEKAGKFDSEGNYIG